MLRLGPLASRAGGGVKGMSNGPDAKAFPPPDRAPSPLADLGANDVPPTPQKRTSTRIGVVSSRKVQSWKGAEAGMRGAEALTLAAAAARPSCARLVISGETPHHNCHSPWVHRGQLQFSGNK